jgi:hypothetical protein
MQTGVSAVLAQLELLDFNGKGESFVESKFLTPLLECLGYEWHSDYEVIRHGDDGAAFKLQYPPVEKGAVRVKHYNPDYIPTIRKKAFWIVEAKSPKDVSFPFEVKYLVQGFQYCIHPEVQAKYLVVSNGSCSAIYDAHGAVFLGKEIYEPILTFNSSELGNRWPEIYELISAEKLRSRIEADVKAMYDKLCLSSLDVHYPANLLHRIGASTNENLQTIRRHVAKLQANTFAQSLRAWHEEVERLDVVQLFNRMNLPVWHAGSEAEYFVEKSLASGVASDRILQQLISDFDRQSIFRKEQTFIGVARLYMQIADANVKTSAREFLDKFRDGHLPLLNQAECAALRLTRKVLIVSSYPKLRERLKCELESMPEMVRFVRPPSALDLSYMNEIIFHHILFDEMQKMPEAALRNLLDELQKLEARIEEDFKKARSQLSVLERQIGGFEYYGINGTHYAFENILKSLKVE